MLLDIASVVLAMRQNWPPLIPVNATWTVLVAVFLLEPAHPGAFVVFTLLIAALHFGAAFSGRATPTLQIPLYAVAHACFSIAGLRAIVLWATAHASPPIQASLASELGSVFLALYAIAMMTSLSCAAPPWIVS